MIENELLAAVHASADQFLNDPKTMEFEKAYADFKAMVKVGVAKERGYNLFSIDSAHLARIHFNARPKPPGPEWQSLVADRKIG